MEFSKFLPVVIEIVIDGDGSKTFICRNSKGFVLKILRNSLSISTFVDELCNSLMEPVSSLAK